MENIFFDMFFLISIYDRRIWRFVKNSLSKQLIVNIKFGWNNNNGANNTRDKSYTYIQGIQICNWVKEQRPKVIECWQYISSLISCCGKVQKLYQHKENYQHSWFYISLIKIEEMFIVINRLLKETFILLPIINIFHSR